jgi:hypothetical protein
MSMNHRFIFEDGKELILTQNYIKIILYLRPLNPACQIPIHEQL